MFAELLACSNFSFLRGASHPEELVERAFELGLLSLGLCDKEGLYGAVRGYAKAKELGQGYLVGAELSLDLTEAGNNEGKSSEGECAAGLVLYPENAAGYTSLCRAITLAHQGRPKGTAGYRLYHHGLPASGLVFIVPADSLLILDGRFQTGLERKWTLAERMLSRLASDAPRQGYLGIFRHRDGLDATREALVRKAHADYGFPIIASARPRYHRSERRFLADVLDCIRRGVTLDAAGSHLEKNSEASLLSEEAMRTRFADHPEWVERTVEVVERCRFELSAVKYKFPCRLPPGQTATETLRALVDEGARCRYPKGVSLAVRKQLEHELSVIASMDMASYFLSTYEVVMMAKRRGILCQGRGSAANSAVCFVLGITAVDPARSQMLFERFMSPERQEPPDIDIDFEHERREEIIADIYQHYGRDRSAMVSEVICYRARSALREVAKAFGLSPEQVERLAGLVAGWDKVSSVAGKLSEVGLDEQDERLGQLLRLAQTLEGFPRHLSIHVGGFVLSSEPIETVCPVEPGRMPGRTVVPWDKDDIDRLGFFKVDILGLGMLTALRKALWLVHQDQVVEGAAEPFCPIEALAQIPAEDPAVYRAMGRADTMGVFQIESRAQMSMLPRLRPACFYDLVIEVAIVRPGPIHGGMVHPYLRRRDGREAIRYAHESLRPILERTLGVPLFQEQVMQIAILGAGYSGGEADQLRRDMAAWRKNGRLLRHRERLLLGFSRNGIDARFGEALFEQIKGFGEYGFPESHAASFALLVYASAFLKVHYAAHFVTAILNAQPMGFYSPHSLVRDAVAHGVTVCDVDVSFSQWDVILEGERGRRRVRLGFRLVRGLGRAFVQRLVEERALRPFADLEDFRLRLCPPKDTLSTLAASGAFESLGISRRAALWSARRSPQSPLFAKLEARGDGWSARLPPLGDEGALRFDYATKGLCLGSHPLEYARERLKKRGVVTAAQLPFCRAGQEIQVAGLVLCRQRPMTAHGVLFVTLEDETGVINLMVRPDAQQEAGRLLDVATVLLARGRLERTEPGGASVPVIHLMATYFERLDRGQVELQGHSRDFR